MGGSHVEDVVGAWAMPHAERKNHGKALFLLLGDERWEIDDPASVCI